MSLAAASLTTELYQTALEELPALISDNDLHISQLVLTLLCTVMEVSPSSVVTIKEHILPNTLSLVLSSLLQGSAMIACLNFFRKLVQLGLPGLDFGNIFRVSRVSLNLCPFPRPWSCHQFSGFFWFFFISDADGVHLQPSSPASATDNNTSAGRCGLCHHVNF